MHLEVIFMTTTFRDKVSAFLGIKKIKPKPPLMDILEGGRMVSLTRQLASRNPTERQNAEKALAVNKIEAKPYLEQIISKPGADANASVSAIRLLGMINGPGAIPGSGMVPSPPSPPRGLIVDQKFVAHMEEKLRETTDPRLRKEIIRILEMMRTRPI